MFTFQNNNNNSSSSNDEVDKKSIAREQREYDATTIVLRMRKFPFILEFHMAENAVDIQDIMGLRVEERTTRSMPLSWLTLSFRFILK